MFKPLYFMFRTVGFLPNNTKSDKYFTTVGFILVILSTSSGILFWNFYESSKPHIKIYTIQSFLILIGLANIGLLIQACFRKDFIMALMNSLSHYEHPSMKLSDALMFFGCNVFNLTHSLLSFYNRRSIFVSVNRLITAGFSNLALVQQLQMVLRVTYGFSAVNNQLRTVAAGSQTSSLASLRADLNSVFRQHARLRQLVVDINSYFGPVCFLLIACKLGYFVGFSYYTLVSINDDGRLPPRIITITFITATSLLILLLVNHECSEKARETMRIAHRMLDTESPIELMEDVEMYSLSMLKDPVKLTAAGVFNLDRGFITKAMSATISYLIVAIQLRNVNLSPKPIPTGTDVYTAANGTLP